jgi:hypothetical protein
MAVVGRFKYFLLLLFTIFVTTVVSGIYGQTVKTLYVAPYKENTNIHVFETSETGNLVPDSAGVWKSDALTGHNLYKRSAVSSNMTHVSFHFCKILCVCVSVCVSTSEVFKC